MTVPEALERALHRIRQYGWRQDVLGDEEEGFCLVGSLRDEEGATSPEVVALLFQHVPEEHVLAARATALGALGSVLDASEAKHEAEKVALSGWNDAPDRTKEEVCELLRSALLTAEDRERPEFPPLD